MTKAEKTRQFIVEKTAPIFNRKGYAGTSLNDITHATGLTKGSIYGNFADKDEVALAVFEHNLSCVASAIRREMDKQTTMKGKLLVYTTVYENLFKQPGNGGCPILNTSVEADDTHQQLKEKAGDAVTAWKNSIVKLIRKGIENKEFRKDIDVEQTALTMVAMLEGAIMIARVTNKLSYLRQIMQSVEKAIHELE